MKCTRCGTHIGWIRAYRGVECSECGAWNRSETARLLVWGLLVDVLVIVAFLLKVGWISGTVMVLGGGIALFFLMGCKIQVKGLDLDT